MRDGNRWCQALLVLGLPLDVLHDIHTGLHLPKCRKSVPVWVAQSTGI
jgi:hypothetical protein